MTSQSPEKALSLSDIPQEVLKEFLSKNLTFPALTGLSLLIGGIIFLIYFTSIKYMPEIDLKSATSLLGASTVMGGFIYIGLSYCLIMPGICYPLLIKADKQLVFLAKNDKVEGFFSLSTAGLLLLIGILLTWFFVSSPDRHQYWYLPAISLVAILVFICLLNNILRKSDDGFLNKILLSFKLLFFSYMMFCFNFISSILIFIVSSQYLINQKDSFKVFLISLIIYFVCIVLNNTIIINKTYKKESQSHKSTDLLKYLLLSFLTFTIITIPFEAVDIIPQAIVRLYGWGDIRNSTLIIDYKGCQIFESYHIKVEEKCLKDKDVYRFDNIDILLALGKNYLLRGRREVSSIERYHFKIQNNGDQKSFDNKIELTMPSSSVISWSRSKL